MENTIFLKQLAECLAFSSIYYSNPHNVKLYCGGTSVDPADKKAAAWFRKMRNDGRREIPKEKDHVKLLGWNLYMTPEQAARGLSLFYWRIKGKPDMDDLEMTHGDISYIGA